MSRATISVNRERGTESMIGVGSGELLGAKVMDLLYVFPLRNHPNNPLHDETPHQTTQRKKQY
jgi:hypothetical protein